MGVLSEVIHLKTQHSSWHVMGAQCVEMSLPVFQSDKITGRDQISFEANTTTETCINKAGGSEMRPFHLAGKVFLLEGIQVPSNSTSVPSSTCSRENRIATIPMAHFSVILQQMHYGHFCISFVTTQWGGLSSVVIISNYRLSGVISRGKWLREKITGLKSHGL